MNPLDAVYPALAARVRGVVAECAARGVEYRPTSGLRTWAEQDELYAIGRTKGKPGAFVTKARGGQSYHNFGLAVDLVCVRDEKACWALAAYKVLGEEAAKAGLVWGGAWKFVDVPHVQWGEYSLASMQATYQRGGLAGVWRWVEAQRAPGAT